MSSPIFKTQTKISEQLDNQAQKLEKYVDRIDKKIYQTMRLQNSLISIKKRQLTNQMQYMQQKKHNRFFKFTEIEDYFVKYCQNVLKQDVSKWTDNSKFFIKLFKLYESQIQKTQQKNVLLKNKLQILKNQVKISMRAVKQSYISSRKVQSRLSDEKTVIKQNNTLQPGQQSKQMGKVTTEMSFPSLSKLSKVRKIRQKDQKQILSSTQKSMSQIHYMNPIKKVKVIEQSKLGQLSEMLQWYLKNHKSTDGWFYKVLFYQRNYNKLQDYLKDHSYNKVRRVVTEM